MSRKPARASVSLLCQPLFPCSESIVLLSDQIFGKRSGLRSPYQLMARVAIGAQVQTCRGVAATTLRLQANFLRQWFGSRCQILGGRLRCVLSVLEVGRFRSHTQNRWSHGKIIPAIFINAKSAPNRIPPGNVFSKRGLRFETLYWICLSYFRSGRLRLPEECSSIRGCGRGWNARHAGSNRRRLSRAGGAEQ